MSEMMNEINKAITAQKENKVTVTSKTITKAEMHEYVDGLNQQVWYEKTLCRKDAITSKGNQRRLYFVPGRASSVTVEIMRTQVAATKYMDGKIVGRKVAKI